MLSEGLKILIIVVLVVVAVLIAFVVYYKTKVKGGGGYIVFVRDPRGSDRIPIELDANDYISDLYNETSSVLGLENQSFDITFQGKKLPRYQGASLADYNIGSDVTVDVILGDIVYDFNVFTPERTFTVRGKAPPSTTIGQILLSGSLPFRVTPDRFILHIKNPNYKHGSTERRLIPIEPDMPLSDMNPNEGIHFGLKPQPS